MGNFLYEIRLTHCRKLNFWHSNKNCVDFTRKRIKFKALNIKDKTVSLWMMIITWIIFPYISLTDPVNSK